MEEKKAKFHIPQQQLKCRNGCGHFGTPQCQGLCSVCWKVFNVENKKLNDFNKNKYVSQKDFPLNKPLSRTVLQSTSRQNSFDNSRPSLSIKNLLKKSPSSFGSTLREATSTSASILTGSPFNYDSQSVNNVDTRARSLSPDSNKIMEDYQVYLTARLPKALAKDIDKSASQVIAKLFESTYLGPDEQSEIVQNFYETLWNKLLNAAALYRTTHHIDVFECVTTIEKVICIRCYDLFFGNNSEEEIEDISLQDRIRSLNWVNNGFLETCLNFSAPKVRDLIDEAVAKIIDINVYKSAEGKLNSLIGCCVKILEALKESMNGVPPSADEFLPGLIYVILRANPPLIQSNMKFISRFAHENRVIKGESGYYFTNLSCAIQYIQNLNAASLNMQQKEFDAYVSGKLSLPLVKENCLCNESVIKMQKLLDETTQVGEDQMLLHKRIQDFECTMEGEKIAFISEIGEFKNAHPSKELLEVIDELKLENE
uniref:VPS9 domain-containing protein n=1 Tax=Rhabditophanes sp. KR3021 TaxID=114890 RepID=A0AC35UEK4_9BILA